MAKLTAEQIEIFASMINYDHETGKCFWNENAHYQVIGKEITALNTGGYIQTGIRFEGKRIFFLLHPVIYQMFVGDIPEGCVVDRINQDKTDNRIENLRLATHTQNHRNTGKNKNNTTGVKGVCIQYKRWTRKDGSVGKHAYYHAQVNAGDKIIVKYCPFDLGLEFAELVASELRAKYHGEFACD